MSNFKDHNEPQQSHEPDPEPVELCVFDRGRDEQLRVSLNSYLGHKYISCQVWYRSGGGRWQFSRTKHITIKVREIRGVIEALGNAEKLLG